MTPVTCPRCKAPRFHWFIDEEAGSFTFWSCQACALAATEDESVAAACPHCGAPRSWALLVTDDARFRFCFRCLKQTPA